MNLSNDLFTLKESGVRGGSENFSWESLKSMPRSEREHYLGQSLQSDLFMKRHRSNRHGFRKHMFDPTRIMKVIPENIKNERETYIAREKKVMSKLLGIPIEEGSTDECKPLKTKNVLNSGYLLNDKGSRSNSANDKIEKKSLMEKNTMKCKYISRSRSFSRSLSPIQ
ncbi:hypothetical protein FG379_000329 [Cryptosporidium bovis]|uniref:uncharacterized protein n=1 Tax=Cryptosporidium bovis TaxID=310047 RepID=UPI00351AA89D|nr:hypothetical protein FG379_000329 [Cryptosporidium bovis]